MISLMSKLKEKNTELVHSSLGLEHLFRELGQLYEARDLLKNYLMCMHLPTV